MAVDKLSIEVEANTSGVDKLNESLKKLNNQLSKTDETGKNASSGFKKITQAVNGFSRSLERINITPIERLANALEKINSVKLTNTGKKLSKVANDVGEVALDLPTDSENKMGYSGIDATGKATPSGAIEKAAASADKLSKSSNNAATSTNKLSKSLSKTGMSASKATPPLLYLVKIFGRMILFNLVFRLLMLISDAVKVGVTNLYEYSKAWDNIDWMKTQKNMDDLAATSQQLKNTFGVTLISILVSIKPILDALANAFMYCANAVNQFLAALNGSTVYTKAIKQAKEWGEATSSAAKAAKNATAGIDELNIISDSSGGGGKATPDYSTMFEEVEISSKIKDTVQWLQDHLELIKDLAIGIGIAFGTWKILSLFPSKLLTMADKLGILLAVLGAIAYVISFIDAWKNGVDWENTIGMIGGLAAVTGGLAIAFGLTAAAIGLVVGGLGLLVVGLKDAIDKGKLTAENFTLLAGGITAVAVGIGLLAGLIPGLVAAAVGFIALFGTLEYQFATSDNEVENYLGGVLGLITIWKRAGETAKTLAEHIDNFGQAITRIGEAFEKSGILGGEFIAKVGRGISEIAPNIEGLIKSFEEYGSYLPQLLDGISKAWETVKETIQKVWQDIQQFLNTIWGDIAFDGDKRFGILSVDLDKTFRNIKENGIDAFNKMKKGISDAFSKLGEDIKSPINSIMAAIEGMCNGIIHGINNVIDVFNKFLPSLPDWVFEMYGVEKGSFSITHFADISLPRFANGGMVESGQLFIANEAGPELVGSMGGTTTVANNEQIVSGIQHGVEVAVASILAPYLSDIAQNTRKTANKDFSVNIGDRDIARANVRGQKSLGRSIIATV